MRKALLGPLAALLGCASLAALAQTSGLEVTLQVLDDVSDIEGVLMSVTQETQRTTAESNAEERRAAGAPAEGGDGARPRESELGRELDREDESEVEVEDFDVPTTATP